MPDNRVGPARDMRDLTLKQFVEIHNQLRPGAPVKRFGDRASASRAVQDALDDRKMILVVEEVKGEIQWRLSSRSRTPDQRAAEALKKMPPGGPRTRADRQVPDNMVIRLQTEGNPKRPGGMAAARFALYRDGITVGDYIDACAAMENSGRDPDDHIPRHRYLKDIRWDVDHGFIRIEEPAVSAPVPMPEAEPERKTA